jgi:hypothetical protein
MVDNPPTCILPLLKAEIECEIQTAVKPPVKGKLNEVDGKTSSL